MIRLSAFADEIALDPNEQVQVLQEQHIHFIDLRSAWGINVLNLSDQQLNELQRILEANGIGVAAIGSPLGKVAIDSDQEAEMQRLNRAIQVAQRFGTRYIRIFSFYPPSASDNKAVHPDLYRDKVMQRLHTMAERSQEANVVLVHENEKEIYGDVISRNVDIFKTINSSHLRSVLDPANYLQCEQEPYPEAYEATRPWLEYVHVKDVKRDGTLAVAGAGAGDWPELLRRLRADNYDGFLALEPHLAAAGQYQGFSGPELFRQASQALQSLLQQMNWQYA